MHIDYTRERIRQVAYRVRALVHADTRPADRLRIAGPVDRLAPAEAGALPYADARLGMPLGPLWATWWLRLAATVPPEWAGAPVDLLLETNSEATLWLDGEPVQGLVSGPQFRRPDARLRERARAGEPIEAAVEIACNGLFGWAERHPPPERPALAAPAFALERCELARFDAEAWALAQDLAVLVALMDAPDLDPAWAGELTAGLNRFCNAWSEHDRAGWPAARAVLAGLLARRNGSHVHAVTAIGHAHIDTAWLWPLEETYRKCVRSFATQLRLLERYPAAPLRLLAGAAVRLDQGARSGAVGAHPARRSRPGAGCPSAAAGSSRTATCPRANRSCASSCTASASSRASSGGGRPCSGTPTCSATTASCRSSCAARA